MTKPAAVLRATRAAEEVIASLSQPSPVTGGVPDGDPAHIGHEAPPSELPDDTPGDSFPAGSDSAPSGSAAEPDAGGGAPNPDGGFEHKFRVLQGKYTAETTRMRTENTVLAGRLESMETLLAQLVAQRPAASMSPPESPPEPRIEVPSIAPVSDREVEEFGADMLDAASRFTLQKLMPLINSLSSEVATLRGQFTQTAEQASAATRSVALSARDRMFKLLDTEVEDWRVVNTDQAFKTWLGGEDAFTGEPRQALLLRAYERNDGPRVLRFFQAFKAENVAGGEPATGRQIPANRAETRVNPEALAVPGRGRNAETPNTPSEKIAWTPDSIQAFYTDVRTGQFKNNPQERDRLERDIFAAQREGRILPQ